VNTRNDKNTIAQTRANMQTVHNILNGGTEVKSDIIYGELELAA
jgi:hypothetical protein